LTASIIDFLRRLDVAVLHRVNRDWTLPWLNKAMPVFTDLHKLPLVHWVLVPALAIGWLRWKGRRGLAILLIAIAAVGATDMLCHRVIKKIVRRTRPNIAGISIERAPASGLSMPSNHAANAFAAAETVGAFEPLLLVPLMGIAALVAYSRVYVGVHYPSDVLVAALVGLCIGWIAARLGRRFVPPRDIAIGDVKGGART